MRNIPLTQEKFAIVDDEDFNWLNKQKWAVHKIYKSIYYATSKIEGKSVRMHRLILGLKSGDGIKTDHRNGSGLDNRRCNLRKCTNAQNGYNQRKLQRKTSSKYKGVHKPLKSNKWVASIKFNYKNIYIGQYDNELNAAKAYDKKAKELFGEFACINFEDKDVEIQTTNT